MSMTQQQTACAHDLFMMFLTAGSSMPGPLVMPADHSSEARALFEGPSVNGTIAFSLLEDGSVAVRFGLQFADPNAVYGVYMLRQPTAHYSPVSPALTEPGMGERTDLIYRNRRITICWEPSPASIEKQQQQQQQQKPTTILPDTSPYLASDTYANATTCGDLLNEQEQLLGQYASLTPPLDEYTPPSPSQQQQHHHQQQQHRQFEFQLQEQQQQQQQQEQLELEQVQVLPHNVLHDLTPCLFEQCSTGCPSIMQDVYGLHALASREIVIKRNEHVIARATVMKVFN